MYNIPLFVTRTHIHIAYLMVWRYVIGMVVVSPRARLAWENGLLYIGKIGFFLIYIKVNRKGAEMCHSEMPFKRTTFACVAYFKGGPIARSIDFWHMPSLY